MNYDNINDIFAAGVTNMTCLLQDSNNYDGGTLAVSGADFFTFLGKAAPSIYAHGDSYWGIGSDTTHLKIDNRDTRMRSLYREEGTLYSYYRFLKIRWEGWSHYNASGADYQLKYDLVFWDTGDISLHMISIPIQCYDGAFGFTADKNYTFTKPDADSPDITFQYYAESKTFEIKYTLLDLLVPFSSRRLAADPAVCLTSMVLFWADMAVPNALYTPPAAAAPSRSRDAAQPASRTAADRAAMIRNRCFFNRIPL